MRNKWLKLSKLDSQKIKSLLDFADLEKAKQNQSKKDITEILNFIANLNEKKLCDFYNKIDNNIEKLFTLSLHIDLLLRKIISLYKNISINELEESETYDLINYLYLLSIIDSKIINIDEENFFERLHSFRILRNRFAHEFLCKDTMNIKKFNKFLIDGGFFVFLLLDQSKYLGNFK